MVRLALFDIDGTLIRTGGAGVKAFNVTAGAEFQRPNGTAHMNFAGRTDRSLVREFFTLHGIEPTSENFDRFFERYVFLLAHLLPQSGGAVCPGMCEFIQGLSQLPEPPALGLLTGNISLGAQIKLRHFGLWDRFHFGAYGDDHEDRNELARIAHQRGVSTLGSHLKGSEVLVIGDTPHDIRCGRAIGAKVLAVGTGGASMAVLAAHDPDWLCPDVQGLNPATIVG